MDQLEEIKSKIDTVSFISEYLSLKKAGRNFKALCPFHSEKTPSFIVSPERQIWHCFGACGDGGDIFKFLMKTENLEFSEALQILAKRAGVKLVESYQASEQAKLKEKIYKINHLTSEFYHYLLVTHPSGKKALDYVLGRGVTKKSIETFSLGWAPKLWDALITFLGKKKGYPLSDLEKAGLVIKSEGSYYDRFRGRLIFTLRDPHGNVIGFAGRTLDPGATEAKYINSPETPVYVKGNVLYGLDTTREAIKKQDRVIVVEGEFDLISSFQTGAPNVVAIKGSALTEGQVSLLKRFTKRLSLALDADLAGDAAVRRGIETAEAAGFAIDVIRLPQGKDPDECIRTSPGLWQKATREGVPIFDYFLDSALARFGNQTAEGKRRIGDEVLPIFAKISNPIVQSHYLQRLARLLDVSEEVISQAAKKIVKEEKIGFKVSQVFPSTSLSREQLLEEQLLSFILQSEDTKEVTSRLTDRYQISDETLITPPISKIFKLLTDYLIGLAKKFKVKDFIETIPAELVPTVDRCYLSDLGKILEDGKLFDRELEKTAVEIKKNYLRRKLLSLAGKISSLQSLAPPEPSSLQSLAPSEPNSLQSLAPSETQEVGKNQKELALLTEEYRRIATDLKKWQKEFGT